MEAAHGGSYSGGGYSGGGTVEEVAINMAPLEVAAATAQERGCSKK